MRRLGVLDRFSRPAWPSGLQRAMLGAAVAIFCAAGLGQEADTSTSRNAAPPASAAVRLVQVPLPLTGNTDTEIIATVNKQLSELPSSEERPTLIFEFRSREDQAAGGSGFERALSLARYFAGEQFSRVRTVAYVPESVEGHAILPVLACEQLIIAPDAELGRAGKGESSIDSTMRSAYREFAERRRVIPVPIVLGMLDPALTVSEVQLVGGGVRYVLPEELATLRAEGKVWKENTTIAAGDLGNFTGRQLRLQFGFASHLAADRKQLAEALQLAPELLDHAVAAGDTWKAIRVNLRGRITSRLVSESLKAMREGQEAGANMICLWIDSPGGAPAPTLRILNYLAQQDPQQIRTVAFVADQARSVAALVALSCDELYVREDSLLGGPGDAVLSQDDLRDVQVAVQEIARVKGRDWSLMYAMVDPEMQVVRYRREGTGELRYFGELEQQEQQQPEQWQRDGEVATRDGLSGNEACQLRLARTTAEDFAEVTQLLDVGDEIVVAQRNGVAAAIEALAGQPWFARTLLFIAFFALITESSAPGIGVAGFISGLCFLLFFWCQFLNGTAGWLEGILFLGGLFCVALEIFVLPGFGVFGLGGGAMVLTSIVLASQTFIIPRNSYQFHQVPGSLFTAVAAGGGVIAAAWIMRRYLPDAPLVRRLMLRAGR